MKKDLLRIVVIFAILFIAGGVVAVWQGLEIIGQVFVAFFPFFSNAVEQSLKDYLTSAYFIVGIIIFIGSSVGFCFSVYQKKILYVVISGILNLISFVSIISNLASCS